APITATTRSISRAWTRTSAARSWAHHPSRQKTAGPGARPPQRGPPPPGSREVLRRFVEIAHEHGLKVVFDAVVCHTAPNHPWLKERPDWFTAPTAGLGWLWGLPGLNHDNVDVNDYFTRNVLDWITSTNV